MGVVRVIAERDGALFSVLVPSSIDPEGRVTITNIVAAGAAELLRYAAWPETIKAIDFNRGPRRRNKARKK
jgi:hypothetical protein